MKKLLKTLLLAILLILPLSALAEATDTNTDAQIAAQTAPQRENTIDEKHAREALQSYLPGIEAVGRLTASLDDEMGRGFLSWSFQDDGQSNFPYGNIFRAQIDAHTGELLSFSYHPPLSLYKGREVTLTRDQAYQIALNYLNKMQESRMDELEYQTPASPLAMMQLFSTDYTFTWNRKANGIKVDGDGVNIGVNAYSSQIDEYQYTWHNASFPSTQGIKSAEAMQKEIIQRLGIYLGYASEQEKSGIFSGNGKVYPIYRLNSQWPMVDAYSGQFLDLQGKAISDEQARFLDKTLLPVTPTEAAGAENTCNSTPNPESLQQTAKKYMQMLGYSGEVRRSGGGSSGGLDGNMQKFLSYCPTEGNSPLQVEIDANSGQFVGFSRNWHLRSSGEAPAGAPAIDYHKATKVALDAVARFNPELKDQLLATNASALYYGQGMYQIFVSRLISGLPYNQQGVNITIDQTSGEILNYHLDWSPVQNTPLPSLITEDSALQALDSAPLLNPSYTYLLKESGMPSGSPHLVYRFEDLLGIDAVSGELQYSPYAHKNKTASPSTPSPGSPSLELLLQNGLVMPDTAGLNSPVDRRTVLEALLAAANSQIVYNDSSQVDLGTLQSNLNQKDLNLLKKAVSIGILDKTTKIGLDHSISRQDAAVWAVKLLGYQDVAEMTTRVELSFEDQDQITAPEQNYVGLAYGLGLLKEHQPGYLSPDQELTWEDLGIMVSHLVPLTGQRSAPFAGDYPLYLSGITSR
ncbi:MAG TPA: YcdB/YcdC domain-containing protein [Syntrophomonadaceae bacterium]|nr:YcdB/YcdC domain-containing protein [Syntrophomonadaceae bacterium]